MANGPTTNALDPYQVIAVRALVRSLAGRRTVLVAQYGYRRCGRVARRSAGCRSRGVEFAPDSPLEEVGFEPSVPGHGELLLNCRRRCTRAAKAVLTREKQACGTRFCDASG